MRSKLLLLWGLVLLGVLNGLVWQKERTVAQGRQVLLELAPRDPRSLLQGDYMVLRYTLAQGLPDTLPGTGRLVLALDANQVGRFVRLDAGEAPAAGQCLLRYRRRGQVRLGAESFFFQEGDAKLYERARYGELRVDAAGNSVLVGLRDAAFLPLGRPVVR